MTCGRNYFAVWLIALAIAGCGVDAEPAALGEAEATPWLEVRHQAGEAILVYTASSDTKPDHVAMKRSAGGVELTLYVRRPAEGQRADSAVRCLRLGKSVPHANRVVTDGARQQPELGASEKATLRRLPERVSNCSSVAVRDT